MGLYRVARNYRAVYRSSAISFDEGAVVEVDDDQAAWVNNDSPGCLDRVDDDAPDEAIEVAEGETGELADGTADGDETAPAEQVVNLDELDRDQLLAYADEHGIDVNRRLGEEKLREAIAEAPLPAAVEA